MENQQHTNMMLRALQLAEQGRYTVSPNPMVGCVIVQNGQIVGEGYHHHAGGPHAEIIALEQAGVKAEQATVYLTLEPCTHYGKTPPCVDALIRARVKTVVIACLDDNPLVHNKGVQALRAAGMQVQIGLCQQESIALNKIYSHYIRHRRPYVICKWAMSLDGKTVTHVEDARQITSSEAQNKVHQLRRSVDAILVGANTVRVDDAALTARCVSSNTLYPQQPIRIILTTTGLLSAQAKIMNQSDTGKVMIVTACKLPSLTIMQQNVEVIEIEKCRKGWVKLDSLLEELGRREITSLLVEGGMQVHHQFIQQNLVNQYQVYVANNIIGTLPYKKTLDHVTCSSVGTDLLFISETTGV